MFIRISANIERTLLFVILMIISLKSVSSIDCYQCTGTDPNTPFLCNEFLDDDPDLVPTSCENVYGASYCIKHIGRFEASSIKCYQCDSAQDIDCTDVLINEPDNSLHPHECDSVFEAQYCIKSTALLGGIGTKRYCSALDLGNYCNYVKHTGDQLEYRSCVFTCSTDGCNSSGIFFISPLLVALPVLLVAYLLAR